jgi:hypothetical protein
MKHLIRRWLLVWLLILHASAVRAHNHSAMHVCPLCQSTRVCRVSERPADLLPAAARTASAKTSDTFNYASFDCGALVLAANRESASSTAILIHSRDSYMLNKCSAAKFIEIELCEDILIHTIALANFEFFSSMFKDFEVRVSESYPPKRQQGWTLIGAFTAKNVREFQYFEISNPMIWTRYMRIDFVSHYGQGKHAHTHPCCGHIACAETHTHTRHHEQQPSICGYKRICPAST